MRAFVRLAVLAAVCAAAPAAAGAPGRPAAPLAPPDGTYVYAIARNGTDRGTTTLVLRRSDSARVFEIDEVGTVGAAGAHIAAQFSYGDLHAQAYKSSFGSRPIAVAHGDGRAEFFDAPFVTSVFLLPSARRRNGASVLAPVGSGLDEGARDAVPEQVVSLAPRVATTPKDDVALSLPGLATIWFGRSDEVVHEVHFERLNLDVRLVSYSRAVVPARYHAAPRATLTPPSGRAISFASEDGAKLSGEFDSPPAARTNVPVIVFVPPPGSDRNYADAGAFPMFPDLARTFVQRGYAVLRYDTRGTGKSVGSVHAQTWDRSIADVRAAVASARSFAATDATPVYVLGYATGADVALAAAAIDPAVAGVVALAPTVIAYGECLRRTNVVDDSAFSRSALAHDPRVIAARNRAPVFVLHPGVAVCGETRDETLAYDANLQAHDAHATIVSAADLSARFGSRYDADAPLETEAFFPYRFDPSTASAIVDWLDAPLASVPAVDAGASPAPRPHAPPPPPPPPPPAASPT